MKRLVHIVLFAALVVGCDDGGNSNLDGLAEKGDLLAAHRIVPEAGYQWPAVDRDYWPTDDWRSESPQRHGLDPTLLAAANDIAEQDPYFRSLLVVKDGLLVFEDYYHGGAVDQKTEVWSVTKSYTSALIGIAIDGGAIRSTDELMADYLPEYPGFESITIDNVLTHETGLAWDEASQESWIQSADWIAEALDRGFVNQPGEVLHYSSANSHFLSALIERSTGASPGELAEERLFRPLGIEFVWPARDRYYTAWQQLHEEFDGTWRQDNTGLEIGAFGLRLTAREMAKLGFLYLNRGMWDGRQIVSEEWVRRSTRDHVLRNQNVGFGYHWMVVNRAGHIAFDADGWGGQSISVVPVLDMVIVTKCDAVDPQGQSSYRVLEAVLEAAID